jgi:putative tryptophan/tyrosine transport system substrate-binding protein
MPQRGSLLPNRGVLSFLSKAPEASGVKRREFITLLGGATVAWPLAARAQQGGKLPTIGLLVPGTPASHGQWYAVLVQRLRELGWIEGRTVAIEVRWAEGRVKGLAEIAAEFVGLKVDVIVTSGTPAVVQAVQATSVIPIVSAVMGDPVTTGLRHYARPGGNITGLSVLAPDLGGKRLEFLREVVPGLRHLAFLGNVSNPIVVQEVGEVQAAAHTLGLDVVTLEIRGPEDIMPAFEALKSRAQALYIAGDPLVLTNRVRINTLVLVARLPAIYGQREYVEAGGLMSYGPNFPELFRRVGEEVDKILRGAKPGDLPVEQPTKFDLIINLTTAKALGLTIPPTLLARADEVIE